MLAFNSLAPHSTHLMPVCLAIIYKFILLFYVIFIEPNIVICNKSLHSDMLNFYWANVWSDLKTDHSHSSLDQQYYCFPIFCIPIYPIYPKILPISTTANVGLTQPVAANLHH